MQPVTIDGLLLERSEGFRLGPLDLALPRGSRTALIGPSGCGKTTLLRCIAGLERPSSGVIRIGDRVVSDGRHQLVTPQERRLGVVFQDGALWPHMTALKHLRFAAPSRSRTELLELLESVGLRDLADRRPAALSGGEAQRLSLARALAGDPEVLLLDEPLGSVDVHLRDELAALVRSIAEDRGLTLVIVTHDRDEALAMADEIAVMVDGQIVERGAAADLVREPRTPFSARFLAHALILPLESGDGGTARTAFGSVELPAGAAVDSHVLAVLPNDVQITSNGSVDSRDAAARVLQVRHDSFGNRYVVVDLMSGTLVVPCSDDLAVGSTVGVRLRHEPRLLPDRTRSAGGGE